MLFNSTDFLVFFPIIAIVYFAIPHRYRWGLLLIGSYYFYMCWKAEYVLLILASTLIDYFAGIRMEETDDQIKRRFYLILSLISNLGILFTFKYFNFFSGSIRQLFDKIDLFYGVPSFDLLLPVGISFYTFQTLSYTIDVYQRKRSAERHLGIFALYVAFFPQLVAGPIERSTQLLPQLRGHFNFEYDRVTNGLKLMAWGMFKKIVVADRLAFLVNSVYGDPTQSTGVALLIASYFFAFQIYCDFSGYSDIAIGAAEVLGFRLMKNFDSPYFSRSIAEFWRRWHISLSTWFRDYVYIPLGGSRVVKWQWFYNLIIVFVVSGLWHGANWTFVLWGAIHGICLIFSIWTEDLRRSISHLIGLDRFPKISQLLQIIITFHIVLFGWIFFRAERIGDAFHILTRIPKDLETVLMNLNQLGRGKGLIGHMGMMPKELLFSGLSITIILIVDWINHVQPIRSIIAQKPIWIRWPIYYAVIFTILIFGQFGSQEFIYFQF